MAQITRTPVTWAVLLLLLVATVVSAADWHVTLEPKLVNLGSYSGPVRIALGSVTDEGFSQSPDFMGTGRGYGSVFQEPSRVEFTRAFVTEMLRQTGLLAASGDDAEVTLDVIIRRSRLYFLGALARIEIIMEFVFTAKDSETVRVLVFGNGEGEVTFPPKLLTKRYYLGAFNDALRKLVASHGFATVVGSGWRRGPRPKKRERRERIDPWNYGPSRTLSTWIAEARPALAAKSGLPLFLEDFELEDAEYAARQIAAPELVEGLMPGLIAEHLGAFYPGALEVIVGGSHPAEHDGLTVTGTISLYHRGQLRSEVALDIHFKDAVTGEILLNRPIHWEIGGGWGDVAWAVVAEVVEDDLNSQGWDVELSEDIERGDPRVMLDQTARDIALLLVETIAGGWTYPAGLEVQYGELGPPAKPSMAPRSRE